jgi:hypothetical protein
MDANSRNCSSSHQHDRTHRTQETHTPATGQAPLHAQGGRETTPARDTQGQAPFVVRVGLEAARSYHETPEESEQDLIHRVTADHFRAYGLTFEQSRRAADDLWLALRALELHP